MQLTKIFALVMVMSGTVSCFAQLQRLHTLLVDIVKNTEFLLDGALDPIIKNRI